MHTETRLPRNGKEGLLFLAIISIISVNTIAPLIMGFELGFSGETYRRTLSILPYMWVIVVLVVTFIAKPLVGRLMQRFTQPKDGFNAHVLFEILFSVTIISIVLSVVGNWVGTGQITADPFRNFFQVWPRNFAIAFWIEMLVAHPIARLSMHALHARQARIAGNVRT